VKKVKTMDYGTKSVILIRIEKYFIDAELCTLNLEECIKELHPSLVSLTNTTSIINQPKSVESVVIKKESEDENEQAVSK
jgi:hypothetical protein